MKLTYVLSLAAGGALLAGLALLPTLRAQQDATNPLNSAQMFAGPLAGRPLARLVRKLDLTADQKTAALAALRNHQPMIEPLVNRLVTERVALHKLLTAQPINENAIRTQSAAVAAIEADLAIQKAYLIRDLRAIATPEQLAKVDQFTTVSQQQVQRVIALVNAWIANS